MMKIVVVLVLFIAVVIAAPAAKDDPAHRPRQGGFPVFNPHTLQRTNAEVNHHPRDTNDLSKKEDVLMNHVDEFEHTNDLRPRQIEDLSSEEEEEDYSMDEGEEFKRSHDLRSRDVGAPLAEAPEPRETEEEVPRQFGNMGYGGMSYGGGSFPAMTGGMGGMGGQGMFPQMAQQ